MMHAVHFWGQERSSPVIEKERRREGKRSIDPRMKYGHTNLKLFCPHSNGRCSIFNLSPEGLSNKKAQVYYCVLKNVSNAKRQNVVCINVRTQHLNIFKGVHWSFSLNLQFRHFILCALRCNKFYRIGPRSLKY